MNIVVLAAGFATRLYPLTRDRPKPLLEVGDRPVLSHLMDRALTIPDVSRLVLVTNDKFASHFEEWLAATALPFPSTVVNDGSRSDDDKLGAIADLALALESVPDGEPFLVLGGDNLIGFDLAPFARRFREGEGTLLLARRIAGAVPPGRYSEATLDSDGNIVRFREKPADPASPLSCICIYFFPAEVRALVREYLQTGGNPDAPGYFLEWLSTRRALRAAEIDGTWFDIGNRETLDEARRAFSGT